MKQILLLIALICTLLSSQAQGDVTDGRFVYRLTYFGSATKREAIIIGTEPGFNPEGTLVLPDSVFYEGKNYPVVMLGNGDYGEQYPSAIDGFDGITAVRIPKTIRYIANKEFVNCPNIARYEVEEGNCDYKTDNGSLIERAYDEEWRFFRYPSAATAKTFCVPAIYEDILSYAFAANRHLKVLQIVGKQYLWTGWQLGNRCIERIDPSNYDRNYTFENGALYWGNELISYCPGNPVDTFTPRTGTTEIGNGAFCEAPIRTIILPEAVTKVGSKMTFMNSDIEELQLPEVSPLASVGEAEFAGCVNLKSVAFGCDATGTIDIYTNGFLNCKALEHITFVPDTKKIEVWYNAFMNCKNLEEFPATSKMKITKCYNHAFSGCETLTSFPFASLQEIEDQPSGGYQFEGTGLTQVNWPSALPIVPPGCFKDCKQLKKVNLKMTTNKIYAEAFAGSGLTALSMMGVTNYYESAFSNCPDFIRLYFPVTDSEQTVSYWYVPFMAEGAHVVVNNPNISGLDRQKPEYGASLYISLVNGGVKIGDGWSKLYVPGQAADLYRNLTSAPVEEMYSYVTYPEEGAVEIDNLKPGIKITSVIIEGEEAVKDGKRYSVAGMELEGDKMNVTVNYTVHGNPMNSTYEWAYTGIDTVISEEQDNEIWYSLTGVRLDKTSLTPGVYIKVSNGRSSRVMVK